MAAPPINAEVYAHLWQRIWHPKSHHAFFDHHMKTFATTSSRKATNVTIDAVLLEHAKSLNINVSQASEEGLARAVAAKRADIWLRDNQAALESSNAYVDKIGVPLARHRNF